MMNVNNLKRRVDDYKRVLQNTENYRKVWEESLQELIKTSLENAAKEVDLAGKVEVHSEINNLSAVTFSLGSTTSGMSKSIADGIERQMIKQNGSLIYQQLFNGKVIIIIKYPEIEGYGQPKPPKTVAIMRPEELRAPFFIRHLEQLLIEVTTWEDYDDDEPQQKIGFKLNFDNKQPVAAK